MIIAIFFDFGGTLDTDGIHWSEKFWDKYKIFSVPISKEDYVDAYIYSERLAAGLIEITDNMEATLKKQIVLQFEYLANNKKIVIENRNVLVKQISSSCFVDVLANISLITNILKYLSQSFKLGIVSNNYGNLTTILEDLRILNYFNVVIDSHLVGFKKPDPQIFQEAISKLDLHPSNVLVIGDSYDRDIQPAKILGCKTIWLDGRSWSRPENVKDADVIINSLMTDLIFVIEDINTMNNSLR